jgi:hypothetical protein
MGAKRMSEVDDTHRGKRAPNGSGSQVTFRVRRDVVELVTVLARAEGIEPSEWYRRALIERAERQLGETLGR